MPLPLVDPMVAFALMLAAFALGLIGGVRLIANSRSPLPPSSQMRH